MAVVMGTWPFEGQHYALLRRVFLNRDDLYPPAASKSLLHQRPGVVRVSALPGFIGRIESRKATRTTQFLF